MVSLIDNARVLIYNCNVFIQAAGGSIGMFWNFFGEKSQKCSILKSPKVEKKVSLGLISL